MIYTPTLVLGLGGTGFHMLSQIKKVAKENGINNNNALSFLSLDFDDFANNNKRYKSLFREESLLNETEEHVHLSARDIDTPYKKNIERRHYEWFESTKDSERISDLLNRVDNNLNFQDGCGQTRINGKIAVSHSDYWRIAEEKINDALGKISNSGVQDAFNLQQIRVFVYCSSAGASGSGLVLDVLFMLMKSTIRKLFKLYNFIVLPDAYIGRYGEKQIRKNLALPNTYGLLNEIDYLEETSYAFRPTNFNDAQVELLRMNERRSPQYHFLINSEIFKGAANFSLSGLFYAIARFSWHMIEPGFASVEKNFKTEGASNMGKKGIFGSVGYAEIVFNFEYLKSYYLQQLLKKASSLESNASENASWQDGIKQIKYLCEKSDINFLSTDYTSKINDIAFDTPPYSHKKYFSTLRDKVNSNVNNFEQKTKAVVDSEFFIPESFNEAKRELLSSLKFIKENEFDSRKIEIIKQIDNLKCKLSDEENAYLLGQKTLMSNLIDNNLTSLPKKSKKWSNGFPKKIFSGPVKKSFYTEGLKEVLSRIDTALNNIKPNWSKQYLYERVNNLLEELKQNVQNTVYSDNIRGLNLVKGIISRPIELKPIRGTSICLESYLKEKIDKIVKNIDMKAEDYMRCINSNSMEEIYKVLESKFVEINHFQDQDIQQILNSLDSSTEQGIQRKLADLKNTFWNRDDDDIVKEGEVENRKNFEFHPWENKDERHRYSYYSLDIGFAGHNVRNIRRYKQEYEDVLKDRGKEEAVKYFAYDEIKRNLNYLLDDKGIYDIQDQDKIRKRARALDIWAQGWALGFIKKNKTDRYTFHVGTDFEPAEENKNLLNDGIYDLYKNKGLGLDIIEMFKDFLDEESLLDYLESKIQEAKNKSPEEFLKKVENQFDKTSSSNEVNRYRTQKKAYNELRKKGKEKEYELVKEEGQILENIAEGFASEKGIDIQFYDEISSDGKGGQFRRMKFI